MRRHVVRNPGRRDTGRGGLVLVIVLVVIAILTLSAYTFTRYMLVHRQSTQHAGRQVQRRLLVDSAIDYLIASVRGRRSQLPAKMHDGSQFQSLAVSGPGAREPLGYVSFVAAGDDSSTHTEASSVRFGLEDLSNRLNINELAHYEPSVARDLLTALPQMTPQIADRVLDWIDRDRHPRLLGDEPTQAPNQPIVSLSELLPVEGVTFEKLFGRDANRNGQIDANERRRDRGQDDEAMPGGWSQALTVVSHHWNRQADGRRRINLNHDSLVELYDTLEDEFNTGVARFVVAYRMYGPFPPRDDVARSDRPSAQQAAPMPESGVRLPIERGGLTLNGGPRFQVSSVFDLVSAQIGYVDQSGSLMTSPWSTQAGGPHASLSQLEDKLTTTDADVIRGRLNVWGASPELLARIPGLDGEAAEQIVALRGTDGEPPELAASRGSIGWLYLDGIIDLETLRRVDRYLTGPGDVYSTQVLARLVDDRNCSRVQLVLDAAADVPRVIAYHDLTHLGSGGFAFPADRREKGAR